MPDETREGQATTTIVPAQVQPNLAGDGPSTVRTVDNLAQVMVDQWGHRGEYVKGQIVSRDEIDPAHYDWEHATQRSGALRLLTEAEARSQPTTTPAGFGEDERAAMRYAAGIVDDAETVTTEGGPAEPAEFAKPTLPGPANNQPAARPVRTASAQDAEAAGSRGRRTVATPAGPVYAAENDHSAQTQGASRGASRGAAPATSSEEAARSEG